MLNLEDAIAGLLWCLCTLETNMVSAERCFAYTEYFKYKKLLIIYRIIQEAASLVEGVTENWPDDGRIEFIGYSVRYRPETELVLKRITLNIESGEKVWFI